MAQHTASSGSIPHPCFFDLPAALFASAVHLYGVMRADPATADLSDDQIALHICSEQFRPILANHAAAVDGKPPRGPHR